MPWPNVYKGRQLPRDWESRIRPRILARDPECRLRYPDICTKQSRAVDHIGDNADHSDDNLRGVCPACHNRRTSEQGAAARARKRALRYRPAERHPGRVPPGEGTPAAGSSPAGIAALPACTGQGVDHSIIETPNGSI